MSHEFSKKMKELVEEIKKEKDQTDKFKTYLDGVISLLGSTIISFELEITGDFADNDSTFDLPTQIENATAGVLAKSIPTSISERDIENLLEKCKNLRDALINLKNALKRQPGSPTGVTHVFLDAEEAIKQAEQEIQQAKIRLIEAAENLQQDSADDDESSDEDDEHAITTDQDSPEEYFTRRNTHAWWKQPLRETDKSYNTTTSHLDDDYTVGGGVSL